MAEHNVVLELFYDGVWNPAPVLVRDPISYRRGTTSFGNDTDPAEGSAVIDNPSGNYAPLSALSGLRGKIGQNTPVRLSADSSVRMTGEVSLWRPKRPVRGTPWTPVVLSGVLQRLGRGADPLLSAYTRGQLAAGPVDFWPLDDGRNSAGGGNLISGGVSATRPVGAGPVAFEGLDVALVPAGAVALPDLSAGVLSATVRGTSTVSWRLEAFLCVDQTALTGITIRPLSWVTGGGITRWTVEFNDDGIGGRNVQIYGRSPLLAGLPFGATLRVSVGGGGVDPDPFDGRVHHLVLECTQTSGTVMHYDAYWDGVLEDFGDNTTGALIGRPQLGPPISWTANPDQSALVLSAGGVAWYSPKPAAAASYSAVGGWTGETAAARFTRLCLEESIASVVIGTAAETVAMGPQQAVTLLDQLDEIATTDDASIFETRAALGLSMRTGPSKVNQAAALRVSYLGQITPNLEPVYGDQWLRNDVTARNPSGSSRRVVQSTGPRNVQSPTLDPQGVGRYTSGLDVNTATDAALSDAAGWRVWLGTFDGTWYATVTVDLDMAPGLTAAVNAVDVGDVIELGELPVEEALSSVRGLVIGIGESYPPKSRTVTFYLVPAAPYQVGKLAATTGDVDEFVGDLETDGSTTSGAVAVGASSFTVATPSGPLWSTVADDYPMDVVVAGQRVSIASVAGGASPQTFTVRSPALSGNQLLYPVASGSSVTVYQPIIPTL